MNRVQPSTQAASRGQSPAHPDYAQLDECIKSSFTEAEYASMPDEERKNLLRDMTMPEVPEDD